MNTKKKTKILAAIKSGEYTVEIEVSNLITQYAKYDGTPFLRIKQNRLHQGYNYGYCRVFVEGFTLLCNLEDGAWLIDENIIDDPDILSALSTAHGVISGPRSDSFSMCELYARQNGLPEDIDFCMEDEDSCLKDINEIGGGEAKIIINYTPDDDNEEYIELYCTINDGNLFDFYKLLKNKNLLPTDNNAYEISDKYLKTEFPDFYDEIIEKIEENEDIEDEVTYKFYIPLTHDIFELGLYGDTQNN